jgi:phosphoribosyl 1,2-cyclic phosphodiesterase
MIDNGFTLKETERRLARLGKSPIDVSLILVTHEHSDHIKGVGPFARKYNIPVMMTPGTDRANKLVGREHCRVKQLDPQQPFDWQDLHIQPVMVPHDAKEPVQFVLSDGNKKLGILTDLGSITGHVCEQYNGCDALILEANHDVKMLQEGPYPSRLKVRVGGNYGHLNNEQAADFLKRISRDRLQHIVASHISEQNNCSQKAVEVLADALSCQDQWIGIADQEQGFGWRQLS